jgi:hypothetical protein
MHCISSEQRVHNLDIFIIKKKKNLPTLYMVRRYLGTDTGYSRQKSVLAF